MLSCSSAFLFRPKQGGIWDASCFRFKGQYNCYFMYRTDADFTAGSLAMSLDGIHFIDVGPINYEERSVSWYKCFVRVVDPDIPLFVMNHGTWGDAFDGNGNTSAPFGCPTHGGQCLRVLSSTNLIDWKFLYSLHPDPKYYNIMGRWDHAYMQKMPDGSFVAFPVAIPLGTPSAGLMRSADGITWNVEPPLPLNWGEITPVNLEIGGTEEVNGSWYLIGGSYSAYQSTGYDIYVMKSPNVDGPYTTVPSAWRLTGTRASWSMGLAAWAHDYDDESVKLISEYFCIAPGPGQWPDCTVWLLPFRKAAVDSTGTFRLFFWEGNHALRNTPLSTTTELKLSGIPNSYSFQWISESTSWDHGTGIVIYGEIVVPLNEHGRVGIAFQRTDSPNISLLLLQTYDKPDQPSFLLLGNLTEEVFHMSDYKSSSFPCGNGLNCQTVSPTGIQAGISHTFKILIRLGMFELYLDDLYVHTFWYTYPTYTNCAIGFVSYNLTQTVSLYSVQAWQMTDGLSK